jgi:hypothetical protein
MIGILDVLVAIKAAYVPGDEPIPMVNTQPLRIGFQREPLMGEPPRVTLLVA